MAHWLARSKVVVGWEGCGCGLSVAVRFIFGVGFDFDFGLDFGFSFSLGSSYYCELLQRTGFATDNHLNATPIGRKALRDIGNLVKAMIELDGPEREQMVLDPAQWMMARMGIDGTLPIVENNPQRANIEPIIFGGDIAAGPRMALAPHCCATALDRGSARGKVSRGVGGGGAGTTSKERLLRGVVDGLVD